MQGLTGTMTDNRKQIENLKKVYSPSCEFVVEEFIEIQNQIAKLETEIKTLQGKYEKATEHHNKCVIEVNRFQGKLGDDMVEGETCPNEFLNSLDTCIKKERKIRDHTLAYNVVLHTKQMRLFVLTTQANYIATVALETAVLHVSRNQNVVSSEE